MQDFNENAFPFFIVTPYYFLPRPQGSLSPGTSTLEGSLDSFVVVRFDTVDRDAFQAGYADPEQQAQPIRHQARRCAQVPQARGREVAHWALPYCPLRLCCLRLG